MKERTTDRFRWLSLQQAEEMYGVPVGTWRRWLREGRIGWSRLGARIMIRRDEVEALLSQNYRPPRGGAPQANGRRKGSPPPIDPESILADLERTLGKG